MARDCTVIGKPEKRAILMLSLAMSLLVADLFVEEAIYRYRVAEFDRQQLSKGIRFSHDDFGRKSPGGLSLLIPTITIALIRPRSFWVSTGLTFLLGVLFVIGCCFRVINAAEIGFNRPMRDIFDFWDYLLAAFVTVMLFWQITILIRLAKDPLRTLR